jgi:hypothetical protein
VAFPKGPRRKGSGRLVSILHPVHENPNLCRMRKNPGLELVILGNPSKKKTVNPGAAAGGKSVELYRDFHGEDPTQIIAVQESAIERSELVALGELILLSGHMPDGNYFEVKSDDIKLASSPDGSQLYLVGGSQANVMRMLVKTSADTSKDLIEMGKATRVIYETRKAMDNFEVSHYDHHLGEDGGSPPTLFFDKLKRRMFLIGGTYQVRPEGIVN